MVVPCVGAHLSGSNWRCNTGRSPARSRLHHPAKRPHPARPDGARVSWPSCVLARRRPRGFLFWFHPGKRHTSVYAVSLAQQDRQPVRPPVFTIPRSPARAETVFGVQLVDRNSGQLRSGLKTLKSGLALPLAGSLAVGARKDFFVPLHRQQDRCIVFAGSLDLLHE